MSARRRDCVPLPAAVRRRPRSVAPGGAGTVWLAAALTTGAALLTTVAVMLPGRNVTPPWSRALEVAEAAVLLCPVPLRLGALGVYAAARALTSG
ncbi:hypothetical protein [Streptomyces humicola]|uniref:hypothetical protein n=1 Tax=Streptomyces humicola TaxID=2953240 RepID=UPI00210EF00B|nr:hypothetical protein [Streptomyces humicola]